jgi:dihydroxyacetone kinase-like predicted kinase
VFRAEGVRVVPSPGPLAGGPGDPGAEDAVEELLLAEILGTAAHEVVVLPNGPDCIALAARAADRAREAGREVAVVPTRSPVQGLAAVAVADPARRFGEDVIAMAEAAGATRWAEVAVTDQEALTSAGRCSPGNVLGSAEGDVVVIGAELRAVACELLDRLLSAGGELATLVVGPDAALGDAVCAHLAGNHPTVEVTRYDGGPGTVPLLVGVE